jgi:hypothetical protein
MEKLNIKSSIGIVITLNPIIDKEEYSTTGIEVSK